MIWALAIALSLLWLVGMTTSYTFGGLIYILLAAALILVIFQVFRQRRLTA